METDSGEARNRNGSVCSVGVFEPGGSKKPAARHVEDKKVRRWSSSWKTEMGVQLKMGNLLVICKGRI